MSEHTTELIAALEAAVRCLERCAVQIDGEWGLCRTLAEIDIDGDLFPEIDQARAAIAKATGEQA